MLFTKHVVRNEVKGRPNAIKGLNISLKLAFFAFPLLRRDICRLGEGYWGSVLRHKLAGSLVFV